MECFLSLDGYLRGSKFSQHTGFISNWLVRLLSIPRSSMCTISSASDSFMINGGSKRRLFCMVGEYETQYGNLHI